MQDQLGCAAPINTQKATPGNHHGWGVDYDRKHTLIDQPICGPKSECAKRCFKHRQTVLQFVFESTVFNQANLNMRLSSVTVFLLLFWPLLAFHEAAVGSQTLLLKPQQVSPVYLTKYLEVLEDPDQALTLSDVQNPAVASGFKPSERLAEAFNFGYSQSAFWLRLRLKNDSDKSLATFFQIGKARITSVQFHHPLPNGSFQSINTGDKEPFSSRPYPSRFFVFPLMISAQSEQVVYLRIQSESAVIVPAKLWMEKEFHIHDRADYVWQAMYFGLALGVISFSLLLLVLIRDISLLLYVAFSAGLVFAIAGQNGFLTQYLPLHIPLLARIAPPVALSLTLAAALIFMRHMLKPHLLVREIDAGLKSLVGLNMLLPFGYAFSVPAFAVIGQWLNIITLVFTFLVAVFCVFRRQRGAYYFFAAFFTLIVFSFTSALAGIGWLPANHFTLNTLQLGSAVEMLLMALAMADRFNLIRKEKDFAQQAALSAQRQLIDNLTLSERVLEARVQARTNELRQFMDMLNHELKTPMAVIRLSMEVKNLSPSAKRNAIQSVRDMDAIIERCLQADKLDHQQRSAKRQPCDVRNMLVQMCSADASTHRMRLVVTSPLTAHTDPQLLRIALSNLIDNALKYSPPSSLVEIELTPKARHEQAGFQISMANAPGKAGWPDALQLFAKYYRSPGAHGQSGSGLGLYLVQNIAHLLGGNIRYCPTESQVKFELWLPL